MLSQEKTQKGSTACKVLCLLVALLMGTTGLSYGQVTILKDAKVRVALTLEKDSGDDQAAPPNAMLPEKLKAKVVNKNGDGVAGATVEFAISSKPSGATGEVLSDAMVMTDANGVAETELTVGDKTGEYKVTATATDPEVGQGTPQEFTANAVMVAFTEDTSQDYGFDNFTNAMVPWKSVRKSNTDPATAGIDPGAAFDKVFFKSTTQANVTVSPSQATSAPQTVTFTGVSNGETEIQANLGSVDGPTAGTMKVKTYSLKTKTVAIILVHEENDDVQAIPVGQGAPGQTAITAGANGTLNSTPTGDDVVVGQTITTGPNGIAESTAAGDDVQEIAVGNGLANQDCVTAGANTKRDTNESGDDVAVGEDINTGPDGVCDTAANATNVLSTDVNDTDVINYLNNIVYNQAVLEWTVTRLPAQTLNFDLNRDGFIDVDMWMSPEMQVVRDGAGNTAYDHNIFLVDNPSDGTLGFMSFNQRYGFVHVDQSSFPSNTIAHELGHGGWGLTHTPSDGDNLMHPDNPNPRRLRKNQWDTINP